MPQSWKGFLAPEDPVPLSVGKEPELGIQQAPPPGLGETLEASQPLGVSSVVGLSTGEGCWAASRKRWMVSEQHSPLHSQGCPWFFLHFPCRYVNKMYFSQGCVDSGGPTMPRQRGWVFCCCCCCCCSRFKIVLREKSCHKYGGTGVTFSLEVKTPNVDSQDLLEESAGTHSPSPAGSRARGNNTMCPPHHTCFYNFQWVFFPQQCCSR